MQTIDAIDASAPPAVVVRTKPTSRGESAAVAVLGLTGLMVPAGWYLQASLGLVVITALMLLVMASLGAGIANNSLGVLINQRNLMSLSRFQMAMWTIMILATYLTFALARIKAHTPDPLNIQMDWHLWALLGISTTSLVGTPLILSTKQDKEPDPGVLQKASKMVDEPRETIEANREGTLYVNGSISDARFVDMFQGDELNNTTHIDLAKVQMFYFTIIASVSFFVLVFKVLSEPGSDLQQLPLLPDGLIAVVGISNAGYLTSK